MSASHNPPEYNGVKLFDREGRKLTDAQEEEIEALFDAVAHGTGTIERLDGAAANYLRHLGERFGSDLSGLRIAVDCANGAFSGLAPGQVLGVGRGSRRSAQRMTAPSGPVVPLSTICWFFFASPEPR